MSLAILNNIPQDYQLSTLGVGAIAVGVEDIRQSIDLILRTIPGTDRTRPEFGSNIFKYVDSPVNYAIPNIKKAIFDAISLYEPRVKVKKITHELIVSNLIFNITYSIVDQDILDSISWSTGGVIGDSTGNTAGVVVTAEIPVHVANGIYKVAFVLDNVSAYPPAPSAGFTSKLDLYNWVNTNWLSYGKWYVTSNQLICYLNTGVAKTAFLNVTQSTAVTKKVTILPLNAGEFYNLTLTVDGVIATPDFANNINTVEGLLNWLQSNYGNYGNWFLENNGATISDGDFSEDFGDDFDSGGITNNIKLVFQTEKYSTVELTLT